MAGSPGADTTDEERPAANEPHTSGVTRSPLRHWPVVLPVVLVLVALGWAVAGRAGSGDGPAEQTVPSEQELVAVTSDAPAYRSLLELMEASDVVVRATVVGAEHGRWFGDGQEGTRVQSRLVTLQVDETLAGVAAPSATILVEEEGWLDDGTPIAVDGAAPSRVGDDGLWFLVDGGDPEVGAYVVTNAQGRYLVTDDDALSGADRPDPLIERLADLGLDQLTTEIVQLRDRLAGP